MKQIFSYNKFNEAVADGAAGRDIVCGVLLNKLDLVAELLLQSILKALGRRIERLVLHQLAYADGVGILGGISTAAVIR